MRQKGVPSQFNIKDFAVLMRGETVYPLGKGWRHPLDNRPAPPDKIASKTRKDPP